jgi:hypothetical protein
MGLASQLCGDDGIEKGLIRDGLLFRIGPKEIKVSKLGTASS